MVTVWISVGSGIDVQAAGLRSERSLADREAGH